MLTTSLKGNRAEVRRGEPSSSPDVPPRKCTRYGRSSSCKASSAVISKSGLSGRAHSEAKSGSAAGAGAGGVAPFAAAAASAALPASQISLAVHISFSPLRRQQLRSLGRELVGLDKCQKQTDVQPHGRRDVSGQRS